MENPIISLPDNKNAKTVFDYLSDNAIKRTKEVDGTTLPVGLVQIVIGRLAKQMKVGRPTIQYWLDSFLSAKIIIRPDERLQKFLAMRYAPANSNWFIINTTKSYEEICTKRKANKMQGASTLPDEASALLAIVQARLMECISATYSLAKVAGNRPSASSLASALSPCMLNLLSLCKLLLCNCDLYAATDSSANSATNANSGIDANSGYKDDNDFYAAFGISDSADIDAAAATSDASGLGATAATDANSGLSATAATGDTAATSTAIDINRLATTGLLPTSVLRMVSSLAAWMQNLTQESDCCNSGADRARTGEGPTLPQVLSFAQSEKIPKETAEAFFFHYDSTGWLTKTGQPLKSWKGRLRRWVADDHARDERLKQAGKMKKASEYVKAELIKKIAIGKLDPDSDLDRVYIRQGGINPDELRKYKPD